MVHGNAARVICALICLQAGCAADTATRCLDEAEEAASTCDASEHEVEGASAALGWHGGQHPLRFEVSASAEPTGGGTVVAAPRYGRATCEGASCTVGLGATISLQAIPAADYLFLGWSGCSSRTSSTILVPFVHTDVHCLARFAPTPILIQASVLGMYRGSVAISAPGVTCSTNFCAVPYGTPVTLQAPSNPSYRFVGWGGCSQSTDPTLLLSTEVTTRSIQCVAIMQAITNEVSWSVVPESGGTVQRSSVGPDSVCSASSCELVLGETIRLEAVASAGYHFSGWSGCAATAEPVVELTPIDEPHHCQANFEPDA